MTNDLAILEPEGGAIVLPPSYLAARIALAKCERIDECHEWSNKAAALSSYAQQARDDALLVLADRIRARAVRRCGELIEQIPPNDCGKRLDTSRTKAATDAGLTSQQHAQALQVARVPSETFERLVESDKPPKISRLAKLGRKPRNGVVVSAWPIRTLAKWCKANDAREIAEKMPQMKLLVERIRTWCEEYLKP